MRLFFGILTLILGVIIVLNEGFGSYFSPTSSVTLLFWILSDILITFAVWSGINAILKSKSLGEDIELLIQLEEEERTGQSPLTREEEITR